MRSVLVVDDESVLAETMIMILRQNGYLATAVRNGREAAELIKLEPPVLVISDLAMPVMDGLQLLEWLRDHRSMDRVKFIMMTGKENVLEPLKRHSIGADEYLSKPFSEQQLLEKVEKLVGTPVTED